MHRVPQHSVQRLQRLLTSMGSLMQRVEVVETRAQQDAKLRLAVSGDREEVCRLTAALEEANERNAALREAMSEQAREANEGMQADRQRATDEAKRPHPHPHSHSDPHPHPGRQRAIDEAVRAANAEATARRQEHALRRMANLELARGWHAMRGRGEGAHATAWPSP